MLSDESLALAALLARVPSRHTDRVVVAGAGHVVGVGLHLSPRPGEHVDVLGVGGFGRDYQCHVVLLPVRHGAVEVVPVVLLHNVQVVDVPRPVEGVVPAQAGQVGAHAGRDEVVDAGAPPVAVPLVLIYHDDGDGGDGGDGGLVDVPLSATLTLLPGPRLTTGQTGQTRRASRANQ